MRWLNRVLMIPIQGYRLLIGPLLPRSCRFYPSCSEYALIALERHRADRAIYLVVRRLMKCHPFHPGGIDLVP